MILSKSRFPLWLRFVLFNGASVLLLLYKGQFKADWLTIGSLIVAFMLMNLIAWMSSRKFGDWK